jgi:hypothetical protein
MKELYLHRISPKSSTLYTSKTVLLLDTKMEFLQRLSSHSGKTAENQPARHGKESKLLQTPSLTCPGKRSTSISSSILFMSGQLSQPENARLTRVGKRRLPIVESKLSMLKPLLALRRRLRILMLRKQSVLQQDPGPLYRVCLEQGQGRLGKP